MKKTALLPLLGLGVLPISCQQKSATSGDANRPNIIYILADDLGYSELGCYGQEKIETPNIDQLAKEGMMLTDFYSGSPVSAPSRCSLLTGLHSGHSIIRGNDEASERGNVWNYLEVEKNPDLEGQRDLTKDSYTLASMLKKEGYATACVGKWGLGKPTGENTPNDHGFDLFYGYNCQRQAHTYYPLHLYKNRERVYLGNDTIIPNTKLDKGADPKDIHSYDKLLSKVYSPDAMHEEAIKFINEHEKEPFFLYYATPLPHVPIQAPQRLIDKYVKKFGKEDPYIGNKGYFPAHTPHAGYAAMVNYIDEKVGDLVRVLKEKGIYDNTIIIVTSDNGPTFNGGTDSPWFDSAKPFKSEAGWGKCFLREGGIRVPFIASWPGKIKPGTTSDHACAAYDVYSTFKDLLNIDDNHKTDGISFAPTLLDKGTQKDHEFLYWEFMDGAGQQAVRVGKWKAFRDKLKRGVMKTELYNLEEDIQEQKDVADEHPDIVKKLEKIMEDQHTTSYYPSFRVKALDGDKAVKKDNKKKEAKKMNKSKKK